VNGEVLINALASTNVGFNFGYTSVGATPMKYTLRARGEFLG
jgi:hypothetical protein